MLADTGLQGSFQYDATVSTAGVITELTATKVMLTARSFTQALIITAFKSTHADTQNLLLHPMPHPPPLHSSPIFTESLCASYSLLPKCMI